MTENGRKNAIQQNTFHNEDFMLNNTRRHKIVHFQCNANCKKFNSKICILQKLHKTDKNQIIK